VARKKVPREGEAKVLVRSRRRCALCFGLQGDLNDKKGQIAHVDRDPANADVENLAFLCMDHHDQYDSKTSQSKGITPDELRAYREKLYEALATNPPWPDGSHPKKRKKGRKEASPGHPRSLDLYDRRIVILRAAQKLLGKITAAAAVEYAEAIEFAKACDEALFLFDDEIDAYLTDIYRKAMKIAAFKHLLEDLPVGEKRSEVVNEQMELVLWCAGQFDVLRHKIKYFMRNS
jgi:hypothetical protein